MLDYVFRNSSMSAVSDFFDKVNSDPALKAKAKAVGTSDFTKVAAFAKELGFNVTVKEMTEHFTSRLGDSGDLSEADLSSVAGGTISATAVGVAAAVVGGGAAVTSTTQGSGW